MWTCIKRTFSTPRAGFEWMSGTVVLRPLVGIDKFQWFRSRSTLHNGRGKGSMRAAILTPGYENTRLEVRFITYYSKWKVLKSKCKIGCIMWIKSCETISFLLDHLFFITELANTLLAPDDEIPEWRTLLPFTWGTRLNIQQLNFFVQC